MRKDDFVSEITKILKEARRLVKLIQNDGWESNIKIAVLGTTSIQHFVSVIRYLLHKEGINADIYEGEYNGINMDVLNPNSPLYSFDPNMVIIYTHYLDIQQFPLLLDGEEEIERLLDQTVQYYVNIWEALNQIESVKILQTNFVYPPEHLLGNLENTCKYSKTQFYKRLNCRLAEYAPDDTTIVDAELLAENIGKYNWFDYPAYFLTKTGFKLDYLEDFSRLFVNVIKAKLGKTRKCIVLDLDNTLWGGVVGDEGYDGIQLDPNYGVGEAYRYFQQYLLELKNRGIILAVCSKNEEENAKEPFEKNSNMVLHLDDIACFKANWEDKASNIQAIAEELNIGIDSMVFFDDNPAEREIVRKFLPEVYVVDVPTDPALFVCQLDRESLFEWTEVTKEDLMRNHSYIQNRQRKQLEQNFVDYDEYLAALEMRGDVYLINEREIGRFTQLLNKSNQFNLRTVRYDESDIRNYVVKKENNRKCIAVKLMDKFSEYGMISCIILEKCGGRCLIESWVMSCRVLKRNVEQFAFAAVYNEAKKWECSEIAGEYIPSKKNKMVENFYETLGFELTHECEGRKIYTFSFEKEFEFKGHIEMCHSDEI